MMTRVHGARLPERARCDRRPVEHNGRFASLRNPRDHEPNLRDTRLHFLRDARGVDASVMRTGRLARERRDPRNAETNLASFNRLREGHVQLTQFNTSNWRISERVRSSEFYERPRQVSGVTQLDALVVYFAG
jgi:hypothetical protein